MQLQWDGRQESREKKPQRLETGEPYKGATNQTEGTAATLHPKKQTPLGRHRLWVFTHAWATYLANSG